MKKYISILAIVLLSLFAGYRASCLGGNPIHWGLSIFVICGIFIIIVNILSKQRSNLRDNKMSELTKQQIQMDMDRAQIEGIEQMNALRQMQENSRMNNNLF